MFSSLDSLSAITANLKRLFWLRNIAIAGQILAVVFVSRLSGLQHHGVDHLELGTSLFGLEIGTLSDRLPIDSLGYVILALVLFNLYVWLRLRSNRDATHREFFIHLLVDMAALTALLYFSGGATNPFVLLYLMPVIISATVLPAGYTWVIAGVSIASYSLLLITYVPLPPSHALSHDLDMRVLGSWLGFIIITGLIAYFILGMRHALRKQEILLAQSREQILKDQQLVAIGTLAASTTHEMGTPLEILSLLLRELEDSCDDPQVVRENLQDMRDQMARCKLAMSTLSTSAGGVHLAGGGLMHVNEYLDQILDDWRKARPNANITHEWSGAEPGPEILAEQTLTHAILNILNNAADASPQSVKWNAEWSSYELNMEIHDKGPGLSEEARQQAGQNPIKNNTASDTSTDTREYGLGLGLFLSHNIIGRFGGDVSLRERTGGGVTTHIRLPLTSLDAHPLQASKIA